MIDRFGLLPDPAKHLFAITELKLRRDARWASASWSSGANGGRVHVPVASPTSIR